MPTGILEVDLVGADGLKETEVFGKSTSVYSEGRPGKSFQFPALP